MNTIQRKYAEAATTFWFTPSIVLTMQFMILGVRVWAHVADVNRQQK